MGRNQDGKQNQVKSAKKSFEAQLDSAWRGIVAPLLLSAYLFSLSLHRRFLFRPRSAKHYAFAGSFAAVSRKLMLISG